LIFAIGPNRRLAEVRDWLGRVAALPGWRPPEAMFSGYPVRY
jgi:hypothetical protein